MAASLDLWTRLDRKNVGDDLQAVGETLVYFAGKSLLQAQRLAGIVGVHAGKRRRIVRIADVICHYLHRISCIPHGPGGIACTTPHLARSASWRRSSVSTPGRRGCARRLDPGPTGVTR